MWPSSSSNIPDARHAQLIIEETGHSASSKGVATPREKLKDEIVFAGARTPLLAGAEATAYRSVAMRCAYLAHDRMDLSETSKVLAQKMSAPTVFDRSLLKRLGRYLCERPVARLRYYEQKLPSKLRGDSDSDWAGDAVSRKSTTGDVVRLGLHTLKASSTLQSLIALSVGESEYYAFVKSSGSLLAMQSLCQDLGLQLGTESYVDSTTAKSIGDRLGVARVKHMQTRWLWCQERVQMGDLTVTHQRTAENVSDVLTKPLTRAAMDKFCLRLGLLYE